MNERIKKIRNALGFTQQEFADKIKVKRNTVATYEMGRSVPSDSAIALICSVFNVNEEWLRNGTGEMFQPITKNEEISRLLGNVIKAEDSDFRRRLVDALARLDDDGWTHLEKLIEMIAEKK